MANLCILCNESVDKKLWHEPREFRLQGTMQNGRLVEDSAYCCGSCYYYFEKDYWKWEQDWDYPLWTASQTELLHQGLKPSLEQLVMRKAQKIADTLGIDVLSAHTVKASWTSSPSLQK
jgi:hypothetical protein